MSYLTPHANTDRPRRLGRKALAGFPVEGKGFKPALLLVRLFLSGLAGLLALHFWRNERR